MSTAQTSNVTANPYQSPSSVPVAKAVEKPKRGRGSVIPPLVGWGIGLFLTYQISGPVVLDGEPAGLLLSLIVNTLTIQTIICIAIGLKVSRMFAPVIESAQEAIEETIVSEDVAKTEEAMQEKGA